MLDELEDVIYKNGLYYKNKFKKSYEQDLYDAINDWEHLRQGQLLNYKQVEKIYTYMSKNHVEKNKLKIMIKDAFFGIDQLTNQYGLKTKDVWYEAFDNASSKKVSYIRKMRKNGEQLNKKPRIVLSTIHGVKGGEADNVVLLTDLSRQTLKEYERVPDDVNRLFYVGATRTKEHLHIVEPKDIYKAFRI
jgi:superfamily I DNA/RNA helicase